VVYVVAGVRGHGMAWRGVGRGVAWCGMAAPHFFRTFMHLVLYDIPLLSGLIALLEERDIVLARKMFPPP
jgi:hypothetical protein